MYALVDREDVDLIATARGENRLIKQDGYIFQSLDIENREAVLKCIEKYQPDVVINTAAMTNVDACETEKEACWAANVKAVEYLVEACEKNDVHLIHISTDFVFDGAAGPYKEEDEPNPLSYYAASKLASEKAVQNSQLKKWAILRTIIVFGIVDHMSRSNVVLWAKNALEKGDPIKVVDDQFRAPTLAEDLADACIAAAMKGAKGMYHVSGKDIMSIIELVYKVAEYYQLDKSLISPVKSESLNQAAKRPPRTGFIIDKAIRELDYRPHSFEEGLAILTKQLKQQNS